MTDARPTGLAVLLVLLVLLVLPALAPGTGSGGGTRAEQSDAEAAASHLARGREHLRRGAAALAIGDFEAALEITPRNSEAALALGDAMVEAGRYAASRRWFDLALAITPTLFVKSVRHAQAIAELGDPVRALQIADRIHALDPDALPPLYLSGSLRVRSGDFERGLAELEQVLERQPLHAGAALEIAQAHLRRGDAEAALAAFQRANAILINQRAVIYGMLQADQRLGRTGDAGTRAVLFRSHLESWDGIDRETRRIRRNPRDAGAYLRLGRHLNQLRQYARAAGVLETAALLDADSAEILHTLSRAYVGQQLLGDSEAILYKAIRLAPDDPELYKDLSTTLRLTGSMEQARQTQIHYWQLKARADSVAAARGQAGAE